MGAAGGERVETAAAALATARSLLFVPATRPDRFDGALGAGADMVCVDLEDAVAPDAKDGARADGVGFLRDGPGPLRALRINPLSTRHGLADMLAVLDAAPSGGALFLPKVGDAAELGLADELLSAAGSDLPLIALIESTDGLANVQDIARATPRLRMLMFGAADLAAELGVEVAHEPLLHARSMVVHAARRAGIAALDVPCLDFRDMESVEREARAARALGFTGKAMIHPSNVAAVHAAFTPSEAEVERARRVVAAFRESGGGVASLDGKLVEMPVVRAMTRILAIAERGRAGGAAMNGGGAR